MISLDSRTRGKLVWIATMCAPVLAVQGVRFLSDSTPAPAGAAIVPDLPAPAVAASPMTERQREALRWLMDRGSRLPTRSPMDRPAPVVIASAEPLKAPEPVAAPKADDLPHNVKVTSIIGDGQTALAAINHRVRRIGEEVAPKWKLVRIDPRARTVTLRHTDGREIRIEPEPASQ